MGTRRAQERPKLVPRWSKMGLEGGKMGTHTGQEGTREAQVGPKSGQKKRDPKFKDFWYTFGACFRCFFVLQAVFCSVREGVFFWIRFWYPFGDGRESKSSDFVWDVYKKYCFGLEGQRSKNGAKIDPQNH